jgi:hypothetical protein
MKSVAFTYLPDLLITSLNLSLCFRYVKALPATVDSAKFATRPRIGEANSAQQKTVSTVKRRKRKV